MSMQNFDQQDQGKVKLLNDILFASNSIKKLFFSILYLLYISLSLSSFIWNINVFIKINALLGILTLMLLSIRIKRKYISIYVFTGFLIVSFLVSSFLVGRTDWRLFTPLLFIISGFGAAMILLRGYVYNWSGYIVFYGLAVYFFILMLAGVDGYSALKFCSFNGISIVMLVACISLYITMNIENRKIDLKPALITLIVSIWGIGRSGIISSFVLLIGLLLVRWRAKPKCIFYAITGLFIALSFMYATDYSFFKNAIDHYSVRSGEVGPSERRMMWSNYFNNLDISRVIFGVNVVEDPWPKKEIMAYNYHNSFINLHSQTGFMGLITLALIVIILFKFYKINKVFFFLLLTLILRASSDSFIFFGRFDFIPFFFIFYFLKNHTGVPKSKIIQNIDK